MRLKIATASKTGQSALHLHGSLRAVALIALKGFHLHTWLVTGGSGFLGANASVFLEDRVQVAVLARERSVVPPMVGTVVRADIRDERRIAEVVGALRPDVILHCAAMSRHQLCARDPRQAELVNVEGTRHLVQAAKRWNSRLVYVSTDAVFDGTHGVYAESAIPRPFSVYGQTKLEGERVALQEAHSLVVRTNFFGWSPSGQGSILEFFVNALSGGERVKGFTDFHVTTLYVSHLMQAIWSLSEQDAQGIVHVASRDSLSKYEFAVTLADVFGFDANLIEPSSEEVEPREWAKRRNISLDTSRFREITGLELPSQREGLLAARADMETVRSRVRRSADATAAKHKDVRFRH